MNLTLTRKIKLGVHVPSSITDEKERNQYKNFVWELLRNSNRQNFELHNILVKKLIEIDSVLQGQLSVDPTYITIRNKYNSNKKDKDKQKEYFNYIKGKHKKLIETLGGKNIHGFIYNHLVEYIKNIPEDQQYLNSYSYCAISKNVVDKYLNDQIDVNKGLKNVDFYKITQPIPINIKAQPKKDENGNAVKNLGKEWFNKYDKTYTFRFKSIKKHNVELFLNFGKDRSDNRTIINRLYENHPNYKLCDSKIQIIGTEMYLLLSFTQFEVKRNDKLDPNKVIGVDLGVKCAAYVATNFSEFNKMIGDEEFILMKTKIEIEKQRRLSQKNSIFSKGGHGRKRKLQNLNIYKNKERNFRLTFNHTISKEIINTALKLNAGQINIENLSDIPLKEKNSKLLRNWTYFDLLSKIEYKAKKYGIIVNKINPAYTSQKCHECDEIGERPKQDTFICKNPKCKSFNISINADYNAAKNIAKSNNKH